MAAEELVGVVPAAGRATRIGPLPCSKEVLPVGFEEVDGVPRPVPVCTHLLRAMSAAGAMRAYVVIGDGKWDIPAWLGDGEEVGLDLGYLTIRDSPGAPVTIDRAYRHVAGKRVALGFPDVILRPADALRRVAERQAATGADVVLGVLPAERPEKVDMVQVDAEGAVRDIVVKPSSTALHLTWMLAVWGPAFTEHLRRHVAEGLTRPGPEEHIGDVVRSAIGAGLRVEAAHIAEGAYRDVGTPEDLRTAVAELSRRRDPRLGVGYGPTGGT